MQPIWTIWTTLEETYSRIIPKKFGKNPISSSEKMLKLKRMTDNAQQTMMNDKRWQTKVVYKSSPWDPKASLQNKNMLVKLASCIIPWLHQAQTTHQVEHHGEVSQQQLPVRLSVCGRACRHRVPVDISRPVRHQHTCLVWCEGNRCPSPYQQSKTHIKPG